MLQKEETIPDCSDVRVLFTKAAGSLANYVAKGVAAASACSPCLFDCN